MAHFYRVYFHEDHWHQREGQFATEAECEKYIIESIILNKKQFGINLDSEDFSIRMVSFDTAENLLREKFGDAAYEEMIKDI